MIIKKKIHGQNFLNLVANGEATLQFSMSSKSNFIATFKN